jgi:glycosyltransferase involved in cell wall biosynthesis
MNKKGPEGLLSSMHLKDNYVIINQITEQGLKRSVGNSRFLSFEERGLSKSRNRAIGNSNADICVIADDDMYYQEDYERTVLSGYEKYPDADVIAFVVDYEDASLRKRPLQEGRLGLFGSMKLSSVQLTFKRKSVQDKFIQFNEDFGAGAKYYMGEENIFLADCLRSGLKIYYMPVKIATLRVSQSSWFDGFNEYNFNVKGLVYYEISKLLSPFLIFQFAIRKRKLYVGEVRPIDAIRYMFHGIVKRERTKKIYFAGDFNSNTGPAMVNKAYLPYLNRFAYAYASTRKLGRILHFLSKLPLSDVILVSGLSKFHLSVIRISRLLGKKTYYLMHGYNAAEYKLNEIDNNERLQLERKILDTSDEIICVSENFAKFLKIREPQYSDKVTYVNNGVSSRVGARTEKKTDGKYVILSVGGGVPLKNNLAVCEAIDILKDKTISYVVIGASSRDGEKIAAYPFVTYHESLSHNDVLKEMRAADLYIQNSSFETFGMAVCEAVGEGCDILLHENVGAISIIENVTTEDIIRSSHNSKMLAEKIADHKKHTRSFSFVESSSWRDASARLLSTMGIEV